MPNSLVKRYQMLDFCGDDFYTHEKIHPERVFSLNNHKIKDGEVVYLMTREYRLEDNWGLLYALEMSRELHKNLKVILPLWLLQVSERQKEFLAGFLPILRKNFAKNSINFDVYEDESFDFLADVGMVVCDFDPVLRLGERLSFLDMACFEVDSHNIIPARYASSNQEFAAATFRPSVYTNIGEFLTEFPTPFEYQKTEAYEVLEDFLKNKLDNYAEQKNDPTCDFVSGLSRYFHFGLISAQRVAIAVIKSDASRQNKESFLEEMIVRKELSDNFCLYNNSFDSYDGAPTWAKENLSAHQDDIREYIYNLDEFEAAQTHESLWNACQMQLLQEGKIHGYLRMYWAKKILEWSQSPVDAVKIGVYLNDKYALDGNDPNGYVGVLWAMAGLHDRPFFEREVFGKIRYMNENGCRRKFDTAAYIRRYL